MLSERLVPRGLVKPPQHVLIASRINFDEIFCKSDVSCSDLTIISLHNHSDQIYLSLQNNNDNQIPEMCTHFVNVKDRQKIFLILTKMSNIWARIQNKKKLTLPLEHAYRSVATHPVTSLVLVSSVASKCNT